MIKIAIAGCSGRMGQMLLAALSQDKELVLAGGTVLPTNEWLGKEIAPHIKAVSQLEKIEDEFDILIDFTAPEATLSHIEYCLQHNKKVVIGTTGLSNEQKKKVKDASEKIAIVMAPNTSVGVNLSYELIKQAAKTLGQTTDIQIIEAHHRHKVDAPSGTALAMGKAIHEVLPEKKVNFSSIRAGDIVGDHTVLFASDGERIEITHRATSRQTFALGALRAAKWLADKQTGLYNMQDVLR